MTHDRHLRVVRADELPEPKPAPDTSHPFFGWQSSRYPRTNGTPHAMKVLLYPPNGNVDEWVDHGPHGAPSPEETA